MTPILPVSARLNYGPMRMLLYEVAPGLTVGSAILAGDLHGVYDLLHDTIVIDRSMTYTRKRCTLVHELVHRAYGDYGHQRERRCRIVTARLLIDEQEYARAEAMYEGDPWLMADELNVTVQVVLDYREWLHESRAA
ncbi:ImmA/IrrE family metallo-endopeptidase [Bifidobacterium rousetti]|uniref:ImmA/IrrE family metallo-endopeptidase n=1 Tax=Bifidobacterium rousetti TaxID=2045439 RepID=UPI0012395110|nr:ImmA/IrrE family metallo-endopeptidase [Bifidobacterium rousetti]